ncbi:hypothetical protein LRP49_00025 [Enterovibrio sp. ZSDZ35]|uniref:Uncharacterized protein n=1 Tax=Enterovibrio qingdaonensis TaxID=2899818 RepID=A0ABT5QGF0_9GAMM|nr:hypothetical protein [Enterovibrio sp. ZSDZ35]MDD1779565.1 hypothetical protein [Enterovibrio sp. ZSDZ35]
MQKILTVASIFLSLEKNSGELGRDLTRNAGWRFWIFAINAVLLDALSAIYFDGRTTGVGFYYSYNTSFFSQVNRFSEDFMTSATHHIPDRLKDASSMRCLTDWQVSSKSS